MDDEEYKCLQCGKILEGKEYIVFRGGEYCSNECVEKAKKFPKIITMYLHSSKEDTRYQGHEIALSESAIDNEFVYALYEVGFEVKVQEDGSIEVLKVLVDEDEFVKKVKNGDETAH
jgi:hypothetical protein